MAWSFRLGKLAGIDLRIHITFFLIIAFGAWLWGSAHGLPGALFGALMMVLLFVCVTLHELGHALAARRVGIPTKEILLLPIGGVAVLARTAVKPAHELFIAAAGPLVNVVILLALVLFGAATGMFNGLAASGGLGFGDVSATAALLWLIQANVALVLFNLIPAFPLDGGRMLRAGLAMRLDEAKATRIATYTGQGLAVALGVFGLLSFNFLLVIVALFIYMGAGHERGETRAQSVLSRIRAGEAYNRHALTLDISNRVSVAAHYILTSYQPDFAVVRGQELLGVVRRKDVLRALSEGREHDDVGQIMQENVVGVETADSLDAVRRIMAERDVRLVAVYENGLFRGLVSIEDIAEAGALIEVMRHPQPGRLLQSPG